MLILTRRPSEFIKIHLPNNEHILVGISAIKGNSIRLAIKTPSKEYIIQRGRLSQDHDFIPDTTALQYSKPSPVSDESGTPSL
jgi:sRNA-binding carbon storage regulator CsrA